MKKLSVLLGLRDKEEKTFGGMLADMLSKFKNKQTLFQGHRDTYVAIDTYADDPTKRSFKNVESTVKDQLEWLKKYTKNYLSVKFSIEKTNAQNVKAELKVEGTSWGEYTTLELLALKSVLEGSLKGLIEQLPIRSEVDIWSHTTQPEFAGRDGIWETPVDTGMAATTLKRMEIINDPHIKDAPNRAPMVQQIDTRVDIGKYTKQKYSGAITNLERATIEAKRDVLYKAVIEALETANNIDSEESDLGNKMLDYLL